ncbi:MAG: hypothetical protein UZ07_CHB004002799 [Chlorobi bacterium OLB7]|nr:MAG: hypothetical protein UZ07_CHB004002799 [Chlorobi bacterium OLB7]
MPAMIPHTSVARRQMTPPRCARFIWRMSFVFLLFGAASARGVAQADSSANPTFPASITPLLDPLDILLPGFLRAAYNTRTWVRDSLASSDTNGLEAVDQIYRRALFETDGDHTLALLAAAIATMEHRQLQFSIGLTLPLTFEGQAEFDRRVAKLPQRLFADLPNGDDRDKLQHFFASAWLARALDSRHAADLIGWGIEIGEGLLLTGEAEDPRDIRANRLGQLFAELLNSHPAALPSMMFDAWNRRMLAGGKSTK